MDGIDRARSTQENYNKCSHFGQKPEEMRALEGRRFMWEDNIKTDLNDKGGWQG
jgi:hypothetical protein